MRIRTQLIASAVLAALVAAGVGSGLAWVSRRAQTSFAEQDDAQQVARHVVNMLALTNEFTVFGGDRVAAQWRSRLDLLQAAVQATLQRRATPAAELLELQRSVADLPPLFETLVQLGAQPPTPLSQRRRELLLERLLAETHEVLEMRNRWAQVIGDEQRHDQVLYRTMVIAAPAALLLVLVSLGLLVGRRVLRPLLQLQAAVLAMERGDLDVRCGSSRRDELGDTARAVDAMALALQQRSAALRASEQLLASVTDNITALVAYIDVDHRYRFANSRHREWLGVDPAAMVGQHVADAMGKRLHDGLRGRIDRALAGETVRFESQQQAGGRQRHFLETLIPDVGTDGAVRGCFAMAIDISERREAELAIAASEQRLHELTNSIPATVCYFDLHERCLYANDSGLRAHGVARADAGRIGLPMLLGGDAYAANASRILQAMVGQASTFEGSLPRAGGGDRYYQAHLVPDLAPGERQRGFYLMTFDITVQKEAQQRQALVERQLRGIADNLPVLISYVDRDERYGFLNATFSDWLGIDPAVAVGSRMADVIGADVYADRRDRLARALAGERVEFTVQATTRDGTKELQTVYVPDVQPDATVAGVFTISTDVTVLKQVQQQLHDLARVDGLTQLPNRRDFEERLAAGVARAVRGKRPIALMFLDIDHFKSINDSLGHAAGDAVLKEFAARLRRAVRRTDTPARLAGDEFVVLLEDVGRQEDAERVAEKIVSMMRKPFNAGEQSLLVTTSVGVAFCARPGPDTALMDAADEALYGAKRAGRNAFRVQPLEAVVTSFGGLPAATGKGG